MGKFDIFLELPTQDRPLAHVCVHATPFFNETRETSQAKLFITTSIALLLLNP